jgi:hypothetical protein
MRVGRERSWSTLPQWTHFDGYQVMQGGRLRAWSAATRSSAVSTISPASRVTTPARTVVRFAVVRRDGWGSRMRRRCVDLSVAEAVIAVGGRKAHDRPHDPFAIQTLGECRVRSPFATSYVGDGDASSTT